MDRVRVMNLVTSYQLGQISRRQFLKRASVAVGSLTVANSLLAACATVPPNAPAPTLISATDPPPTDTPEPPAATDTPEPEAPAAASPESGIVAEDVTYTDRDGGTLMGYLAHPADGPAPAVIVIQEWWGLDEHIRDVTRRFAQAGYAVLAPDLYDGAVATEPDEARKLVMELDLPAAVLEIDQAISYLVEQEFVSSQKAGIVGYCFGGGLVLQTATVSEQVAAAVPYYGALLSEEQAAQVKAPVQAHYGTADRFDLDQLAAMIETIQNETDFAAEMYIYEDAPHAFFNDTRDSYRPDAAEAAWERTLDWFSTHIS